jgi:hypothetical protein
MSEQTTVREVQSTSLFIFCQTILQSKSKLLLHSVIYCEERMKKYFSYQKY